MCGYQAVQSTRYAFKHPKPRQSDLKHSIKTTEILNLATVMLNRVSGSGASCLPLFWLNTLPFLPSTHLSCPLWLDQATSAHINLAVSFPFFPRATTITIAFFGGNGFRSQPKHSFRTGACSSCTLHEPAVTLSLQASFPSTKT